MTERTDLKLYRLREQADRALADHPTGIRDLLLDALLDCPAAAAHVKGNAPAPSAEELVSELWLTKRGGEVKALVEEAREYRADNTSGSDTAKELERIRSITDPARRIAAARAAGLAY